MSDPRRTVGAGGAAREKMRVLFVSHDSGLYGAQLSLLGLLSGLDRQRFEPHVVAPCEGALTERLHELGIPCAVAPFTYWVSSREAVGRPPFWMALKRLYGWRGRMWRLAHIIERQGIDLVYTNTVSCLDGALAARATGRRHLWHLREHVAGNRDLYSVVPASLVTRIVALLSDTVVVNSKALARAYRSGAMGDKLNVVYNGLPVDRFRRDPVSGEAIRRELDLPREAKVVALIGSLTPSKGLLGFIDAARQLKQSLPGVAFVVVGGAAAKSYLRSVEARLEETGLVEDFHFLGWRSDIASILSAADVLAVSAEQEAFGRTLVEAMAAEVPIVATRCGGPEEIVADGETGLLVPVGDAEAMARALLQVLVNPDYAYRLGIAGRIRAESLFGVETYVASLQNLIAMTITSRR